MKKIIIILVSLSLLAGCKKKPSQNISQSEQNEFKEGVVLHKTYYYKDAGLTKYAGALNRGQKVSLSSETTMVDQPAHNRKVEVSKVKLPSEDDVFFVISSYVFKSGYKLVCTYNTARAIFVINKDTYKYKNQDIHSQRAKVKAGIKVIVVEKKYDWSQVHINNGFWWVKNEDLSPEDADVAIKITIPEIGGAKAESSSSYSPEIGNERLFSADMAFDSSINTFWLSSPDAEPVDQWVKLTFTSDREEEFTLSIINGNSKNEEDYQKFSRIKRIRIETDNQNTTVDLSEDFQKYQELGTFKGKYVKLTVLSVYPGSKSKQVAIGSIRLRSSGQRGNQGSSSGSNAVGAGASGGNTLPPSD